MNNILAQLNSAPMYAICGGIIAFVAAVCVVFLVRSYRAGLAIGMDPARMKRAITSSATFSVLPSVGILLGVIALSGSLGTPWPWLRLSVIGALHYETQVAQAAAEQVGMHALSAAEMTPQAFTTIALLMSFCIIWGMLLSIFFNKRYLRRLGNDGAKSASGVGFGDSAMTAMFIGLVCAYIGSYIGAFVSGEGLFTCVGDWTPLVVVAVSAAAMALFVYLARRRIWHGSRAFPLPAVCSSAWRRPCSCACKEGDIMNETERKVYLEQFNRRTHVLGRAVCVITLLLLVGAPFLIGTFLGAMPDMGAVGKGFLSVGIVWAVASVAEFLIYTPMLGAGGGYLAFITGNLINMKIPCAVNARDIAGTKTGTAENEIISTLSIATSSLVTIVVLALGVALLVPLQPVLQSPVLQPAFANVVPALFGAMAYQYFRKNIRVAIAPLVMMSVLFMLVPSLTGSTSFMIVPSGALAIGIAYALYRKQNQEGETK